MSESLYVRLGGTEGITQIASDLVEIHVANSAMATHRGMNISAHELTA